MPLVLMVRLTIVLVVLHLPINILIASVISSFFLGLFLTILSTMVVYILLCTYTPKWFVKLLCLGSKKIRPVELHYIFSGRKFSVAQTLPTGTKISWWHLCSLGDCLHLLNDGKIIWSGDPYRSYTRWWIPVDEDDRIVHLLINDIPNKQPVKK